MLQQNHLTIPSLVRDYPEWHLGRQDYSVWLIELHSKEVLQKVAAAREHLSDFLIKPYQRQPHITVYVCGFVADTQRYDDDYSVEQLDHHVHLLKAAAIKPFSLEIGGLNSFASAPFLEVADQEGGLARVRALLSTGGKEISRNTYTPHITVGLYSGAFPGSVMHEKFASFPQDPCTLTVDRITFAAYTAKEIAGALTFRHEVALRPL
jgi:2'-5' RNA ligase